VVRDDRVGTATGDVADARTVVIAQSVADEIREHAAETYPNECCGALFGSERAIKTMLRLPNQTAEGPRNRFLVLPADYRAAEERASEINLALIGFYHSHPDHPARPSRYDLDHAWPFFVYVIVTVRNGEARDMTSWRLRDDRSAFDADVLRIE
jgi:proteasome lid subunit RPN8/RPN11